MRIVTALLMTLVLVTHSQWSLARSLRATSAVQARDTWRSVATNNLLVIGNTDPETLRRVAVWLEFFHAAFGRLVSRAVVNSSIPTRVVVFKDEASFSAFKPLYQGRPLNLAGYFQPGEHLNHIVILLDKSQTEENSYATAFHEYVHLHLRQNVSSAPLWLNEGLAEFYGNVQLSGGEAIIGAPIGLYLRLLRSREMLPLKTLFSIGNDSPHYNEQEKTGIFYGQSWALVHYLMMAGGPQRQEHFKQFLEMISRGDRAETALESAFGLTVETAEKELQKYVAQENFVGQRMKVGDSAAYTSYTAMQRASLTEAEANYYLGDLLLHIDRQADAERHYEKAVALEPGFPAANASLGLLRIEQRRYPEAKQYLQRAVTSPQNHLIHYLYAYTISREDNAPGRPTNYSRENAATMREHLLRSIQLAPNFAPAYHLLAVVDFVKDERLDEAESMATKATQLSPSRHSYSTLLARIFLRRAKPQAAREILEPLTRHNDASVRMQAQQLLESMTEVVAADRPRSNRSDPSNMQLSSEAVAEPEPRARSRGFIEGATVTTAIRDGQTIEAGGSIPGLDEVLARYLQAMGGSEIDAVSSRVSKGALEIVGVSRNGSFEIYGQAPNKSLTVMTAHPTGTVRLGFNGQTGWMQSSDGLRVLKGLELTAMQIQSSFYGAVKLKSLYTKVSLLGKSNIGFREVYVMELQPPSGPAEKLFLDAGTYLPVRANGVRIVQGQAVPVEVYFDDWRAVDGIKMPFHITYNVGGRGMAFTVKEVKHNIELSPMQFEPPKK